MAIHLVSIGKKTTPRCFYRYKHTIPQEKRHSQTLCSMKSIDQSLAYKKRARRPAAAARPPTWRAEAAPV